MTKAINKKVLAAVLFAVMLLNIFSCFALPAGAESSVAGKWSGSSTAANGTVYSIDLTLEANGGYTLITSYKMGENTYKETENGTYSAADGKITFTGDKLAVEAMEATFTADTTSGTVSGDTMTVTRHASFMAKSMGKAAVEITLKQTEKAVTYEDNLKSGKYELTEESYDASAFMKLPMLITIDTEKKTLNTQDAREGKDLANKGFGSYTFDEKTGIYTVTYTADTAEGAKTSFTYSDKGLTFVTPIYFGKASMNIKDDNGNFIPYTATPYTEPVKYEDNLKAGKYELTEESYDASAFMKLPMLITIDTEKKTLNTQDAREGKDLANKGFGNYTFDEKTGIYTVTYTADTAEGATASFTYSDKGLTFVTPIYFGKASMNITDDNGNFIPYTASPYTEPVKYEDNLKSGKYELTEESYDASAFMKLPMLITIDTEKKTLNTQDAREGKDLANKGFGSYTFDEKTGIYTVTYTADTAEGATASFTYADDAITFVTPAYFGKASMNITSEDGSFIPYTAKLVADDDNSGSEENTDDTNTPADDNSGSGENTDDANTPADDNSGSGENTDDANTPADDNSGSEENTDDANTPADDNSGSEENTDETNTPADDDNDDTQAPADDENAPADDNKNAQSGGFATSNPKTGSMAGSVMLIASLAGVMALAVSKKKK